MKTPKLVFSSASWEKSDDDDADDDDDIKDIKDNCDISYVFVFANYRNFSESKSAKLKWHFFQVLYVFMLQPSRLISFYIPRLILCLLKDEVSAYYTVVSN